MLFCNKGKIIPIIFLLDMLLLKWVNIVLLPLMSALFSSIVVFITVSLIYYNWKYSHGASNFNLSFTFQFS